MAAHLHPEALTGRCGKKRATSGFLDRVREAVASIQAARDAELQIGGPGIDVEADEVSFRARAVRVAAGEEGEHAMRVEWRRWLGAVGLLALRGCFCAVCPRGSGS